MILDRTATITAAAVHPKMIIVIMAIAALSFHVFINFLLLIKVGTKNIAFEHEGNHQNSHFSSANNNNLIMIEM
jgi:hypothetical protein